MNKTVVIILVVVALLLCCCATCGVAAFFMGSTEDWDEFLEELETTTSTETLYTATPDTAATTSTSSAAVNPLLYSNAEYDFTITLVDGWEDYTVNSTEGSQLAGFVEYFDFSLPTNQGNYQNLFTIMVYTKAQWQDIEDTGVLEFSGEEKVGEDSSYVYSFSHINGDPGPELQPRMMDLDTIKESFEVVSNYK